MARFAGETRRTARHIKLSPPSASDPVVLCCEIDGEGPPVLLFPGLGDTVWVWRRLIPELSHRNLVAAVELRGHGRSSSPFGPYSFAAMMNDLIQLIEKLGIAPAAAVAQGFGGRLALALALERPDLLSALVLVGTEAGPVAGSARGALALRLEAAARRDMQAAYKALKSEGHGPRGMSPRERAEHHRNFLKNSPAGYAAACSAELNAPDLSEKISEIRCPVLALTGEFDGGRHAGAERLAESIPGCEAVIVDGAGHFVQLDATDSFHLLLIEFLAKHKLMAAKK